MRLTLRTMLAFMDEVDLTPEDHQDIGRKIEESEFASNLMHRIRDVTRRMRLAAPKVSGRGMGLDPNTVAEYIDNELPGERVPDFERICLESDVHLAEVACCHQILSIVLREAAEVDPHLRRRMYLIIDQAEGRSAPRRELETATASTMAGAATNGRDEEPARSSRPKLEVPEYLRSGSRSRFWPYAIAAALAVCLVVVVILASGGTEHLLSLFGGGQAGPVAAHSGKDDKAGDRREPAQTATTATGAAEKSNDQAGATSVEQNGKSNAADQAKNATLPDKNSRESATKTTSVAASDAAKTAARSDASPLTQPIGEPSAVTPAAGNEKPGPTPPLPPGDGGNPRVTSTNPPNIGPEVPDARPKDSGTEKPAVPAVPANAGHAPAPAADAGDQRVGRWVPDQEVLLRLAGGSAEWRRVVPGVAFTTGDKLLALPTFRPTVSLAAGVSLALVPESLVEFESIDDGVPVVRLHYGRMVMMTTGKAGVKVKLALGPITGNVVFDDADATVAAEVRPFHLPGSDPEKVEPGLAISLYGVSGDASWTPPRGEAVKLHAPAQLVLAAGPVPPTDRELPKWIGAEPIGPIDARAAKALSESLDGQRSVTQVLLEMAGHRREENRSLAARSLALIDEFEPLVSLLSDKDVRSVWPIQIDSLQAALARGPAVAAKVRSAFERKSGKDGSDLYRMLWGYSKEDLANGAAAKLVEYLDHDTIDFRVLAFHNLHQIVGATFNYRPEQPAASRVQSVRRWREQLKEGLLGPKPTTPPGKLPAGEPAATKAVPPPAPTPDDK